VAAAYFTLRNRGGVPLTVTAVSSPLAGAAMIHETQLLNGISSMRPREQVTLAPGQSVRFEPGGLHVMLHMLAHPLKPGELVPLVLALDNGGTLEFRALVKALDAE
jgi:periplasmic copper chaperone A